MLAPSLNPDLKEIGKAVLIAALSAVATSLVQWGLDTIKDRCTPKEDPKEDSKEKPKEG